MKWGAPHIRTHTHTHTHTFQSVPIQTRLPVHYANAHKQKTPTLTRTYAKNRCSTYIHIFGGCESSVCAAQINLYNVSSGKMKWERCIERKWRCACMRLRSCPSGSCVCVGVDVRVCGWKRFTWNISFCVRTSARKMQIKSVWFLPWTFLSCNQIIHLPRMFTNSFRLRYFVGDRRKYIWKKGTLARHAVRWCSA